MNDNKIGFWLDLYEYVISTECKSLNFMNGKSNKIIDIKNFLELKNNITFEIVVYIDEKVRGTFKKDMNNIKSYGSKLEFKGRIINGCNNFYETLEKILEMLGYKESDMESKENWRFKRLKKIYCEDNQKYKFGGGLIV